MQPLVIRWEKSGFEGTEARGGTRGLRCTRQPMVVCLRISLSMTITEFDMGKRFVMYRSLLNSRAMILCYQSNCRPLQSAPVCPHLHVGVLDDKMCTIVIGTLSRMIRAGTTGTAHTIKQEADGFHPPHVGVGEEGYL